MKFDICIGNPPYQNGNQSIYQLFIDEMMKLNIDDIAMITKNNWMVGNTLKNTRDNMIEYGIERIINYSIGTEVFEDVFAAVTIFHLKHRDVKTDNYSAFYTEIRHGEVVDSKNLSITYGWSIGTGNEIDNSMINRIICRDDFISYDLVKNARLFSIASNGYVMHSTYTEDTLKFTKKRENDNDVQVIFMNSSHKAYPKYTSFDMIPRGKEDINKYKLVCGSKVAHNTQVISNFKLLKPGQIVTNSWGIAAVSSSLEEIQNICKYVQTKFFRYLVRLTIVSSRVTFGVGNTTYVPLQDWSNNSDIDWTKTVDDVNQQLYKKYKLTDKEINKINQLIDISVEEIGLK